MFKASSSLRQLIEGLLQKDTLMLNACQLDLRHVYHGDQLAQQRCQGCRRPIYMELT